MIASPKRLRSVKHETSSHTGDARQIEIRAGRLCPFCGEVRNIEALARVGWLCVVCARQWPLRLISDDP